MGRPIRILGIDPGLRRTGWGMIEIEGNRLDVPGLRLGRDRRQGGARACGCSPSTTACCEWSTSIAPDEAAVEATFVNKDAAATLKLGQARGIAMLVPAIAGLPVAEYAPNLVKKTIVGAGHGEKAQIRMMMRRAAAEGRSADPRRRRRARDRGHPCAPPAERRC